MCRRKLFKYVLLLVCVLFVFSLEKVFSLSQEQTQLTISSENSIVLQQEQKDLNSLSMNSKQSLNETQNISSSSQTSSMTLTALLKNQLEDLKTLDMRLETLENSLEDVSKHNPLLLNSLNESKITIEQLKENNRKLQEALLSNKEDTGFITKLFAESQTELEQIKAYVGSLESQVKSLRKQRWVFGGIGVSVGVCIASTIFLLVMN